MYSFMEVDTNRGKALFPRYGQATQACREASTPYRWNQKADVTSQRYLGRHPMPTTLGAQHTYAGRFALLAGASAA